MSNGLNLSSVPSCVNRNSDSGSLLLVSSRSIRGISSL